MKKLLFSVMILVLMGLVLCAPALASSSGTCGANLTWELSDSGKLTISGTGAMTEYENTSDVPWYDVRTSVTSLEIGSGVTSIGKYAFAFTKVTDVTIPGNVTSIGAEAFWYCTNLTNVTIAQGVQTIDMYAFWNCTGLTSVTVPNTVTSISLRAFLSCTSLTEVTVLNRNTQIGEGTTQVFSGCASGFTLRGFSGSTAQTYAANAGHNFANPRCGDNLTCNLDANGVATVTGTGAMWDYSQSAVRSPFGANQSVVTAEIGSGVTRIGDRFFYECSNLQSISLPDGLQSIGKTVFYKTALTGVDIPGTVTEIGYQTFKDCANLGSVVIPYGVKTLSQFLFSRCYSLTSVTIPDSVTSIQNSVFSYCYGLTSITIPDSVTSIGDSAFSLSTALTEITIPESVTSLGKSAFWGCDNLTRATILNPNMTIGNSDLDVFKYCAENFVLRGWETSTTETYAQAAGQTFEAIVPRSGQCGDHVNWTFDTVSGTVTVSGTGPMWDYHYQQNPSPFEMESRVKSAVIQTGVTHIGDYFFDCCEKLTSVSLPDGLLSIGDSAFYMNDSLAGLSIPDTVTEIGNSAFKSCDSLTALEIPDGVTKIGDDAFRYAGLTIVAIYSPSATFGITAFGDSDSSNFMIRGWAGSTAEIYAASDGIPFQPLTSATLFKLPADLTVIGEEAFTGISARRVVIPKNVTSIVGNPFAGSSVRFIYGCTGSAAQTFAANNGFIFVKIDDAWLASN